MIGNESMCLATMGRPKVWTFHDSPVIGDARQAGGVVALAPISNQSRTSTDDRGDQRAMGRDAREGMTVLIRVCVCGGSIRGWSNLRA
jgi:hypothetical protein